MSDDTIDLFDENWPVAEKIWSTVKVRRLFDPDASSVIEAKIDQVSVVQNVFSSSMTLRQNKLDRLFELNIFLTFIKITLQWPNHCVIATPILTNIFLGRKFISSTNTLAYFPCLLFTKLLKKLFMIIIWVRVLYQKRNQGFVG
jgi:hypothetical protein